MERKGIITRPRVIKCVVVIMLAVVVYCVTYSCSPERRVCAQQQVSYSQETSAKLFSVAGIKRYRSSRILQHVLRSYQQYHAQQRRQLLNGGSSKSLTWYCISGCNGIGDRLKGMYAALLLAIVTNRTFFIHQSDEVLKTMLLEPNAIDWRPIRTCATLHRGQTIDHQKHTLFGARNDLRVEIERLEAEDNIFISDKQQFASLISSMRHFVNGAKDPIMERLLHIAPEAVELHHLLTTLHQFLFHVPIQLEKEATAMLKELSLKPHEYVSVHIRTGFKNSMIPEIFSSKGTFVDTKMSWRKIIDCALDTVDSKFRVNSSRLLIVADDKEPKSWAAAEYGSRVTMLDINPVHVSHRPILGAYSHSAYVHTWAELYIMSQSSALVTTMSGFSEVATHMGAMDPLSIYIYDARGSDFTGTCSPLKRSIWAGHV